MSKKKTNHSFLVHVSERDSAFKDRSTMVSVLSYIWTTACMSNCCKDSQKSSRSICTAILHFYY